MFNDDELSHNGSNISRIKSGTYVGYSKIAATAVPKIITQLKNNASADVGMCDGDNLGNRPKLEWQ